MISVPETEILQIGKELQVALQKRIDDVKTPVIAFIHGYGSSKDFFRYAFTDPSLKQYSLIVLDLIGFGDSSKPENFSYQMSNQASQWRLAHGRLEPAAGYPLPAKGDWWAIQDKGSKRLWRSLLEAAGCSSS